MYLLWSTSAAGWRSTFGNYTSDLAQAQRHERSEALAIVFKHKTADGHGILPVREEDL